MSARNHAGDRERVLDALEALDADDEPVSVLAIADELDTDRDAVHPRLWELVENGAPVERIPTAVDDPAPGFRYALEGDRTPEPEPEPEPEG